VDYKAYLSWKSLSWTPARRVLEGRWPVDCTSKIEEMEKGNEAIGGMVEKRMERVALGRADGRESE
jgi:hypothetical protein